MGKQHFHRIYFFYNFLNTLPSKIVAKNVLDDRYLLQIRHQRAIFQKVADGGAAGNKIAGLDEAGVVAYLGGEGVQLVCGVAAHTSVRGNLQFLSLFRDRLYNFYLWHLRPLLSGWTSFLSHTTLPQPVLDSYHDNH